MSGLPERVVGNIRIDGWQRAPKHKIIRAGDKVMALLPGRKRRSRVTFMALVIPLKGKPYLEVLDKDRQTRLLPLDAI